MAASMYKPVQSCLRRVARFMTEHGYPESHGIGHICQVLRYCDEALGCYDPSGWDDRHLAVGLAAVLHEVDDRKFAPPPRAPSSRQEGSEGGTNDADLPHARRLLDETFAGSELAWDDVKEKTLAAIRLVSAHKNGNDVPPLPRQGGVDPMLLVPRYADRLAASGKEGVKRCLLFSHERKRPLFLPTTPATPDEEELALVAKGRLEAYREGPGQSDSMLDHYLDKLLPIASPPMLPDTHRIPALAYLEGRLRERRAPLLEVILAPRDECLGVLSAMLPDCAAVLRDYRVDGSYAGPR